MQVSKQSRNKKKSDPGTIFVGGFSSKTKQSELKAFFSKFGQVKKINMVRNKRGGSKGYCFIQFKQVASAHQALDARDIHYHGRNLNCRPILSGEELENFKKKINEKRVVVTNLPEIGEFMENDLRKIFKNFGKIKNFYFVKEVAGMEKKETTLMLTYSGKISVNSLVNSTIVYADRALKIVPFGIFKDIMQKKIEEAELRERELERMRKLKLTEELDKLRKWKRLKTMDLILLLSKTTTRNKYCDNLVFHELPVDGKHQSLFHNRLLKPRRGGVSDRRGYFDQWNEYIQWK